MAWRLALPIQGWTTDGEAGQMQVSGAQQADGCRQSARQGRPDGPPPGMEEAAAALGLSTDDLREAARAGTSLATLAERQGVARDDVVAAVRHGLEQAGPPPGVPAADAATLDAMAAGIVDGVRPGHGPGAPPPGGGTSIGVQSLPSDDLMALLAGGDDDGGRLAALIERLRAGGTTGEPASLGLDALA